MCPSRKSHSLLSFTTHRPFIRCSCSTLPGCITSSYARFTRPPPYSPLPGFQLDRLPSLRNPAPPNRYHSAPNHLSPLDVSYWLLAIYRLQTAGCSPVVLSFFPLKLLVCCNCTYLRRLSVSVHLCCARLLAVCGLFSAPTLPTRYLFGDLASLHHRPVCHSCFPIIKMA